ncbi:tripartite ATP-independent transporter solute receptor, DctP family [Pontibacter akesuensis]|uniref:Tripartite ATP-independent transporter solute receptor, DctP family n=2 Tax=Pontibacter akesuensis TaxID=388950 RepID=A0A1I7K5X9_9BACT|nr:tripartite ATP-independent transporter solute receptor, DctP family [Pontibacter akesuensis]
MQYTKRPLQGGLLKLAQLFSTPMLLLALLLVTTSCDKIKQTKEIKLAHTLDITHPVHEAMEFMAKRVKEKSGGKLTIDIYPNSQLGTERECLELLQIGSLGMTKVSAAVMEGFSPNFKVLSLPYIFKDKAHYFDVLGGDIGDDLLLQGEKYWLHGLTFYDAGSRSFYSTKKPIRTPGDLAGMKIRVQDSKTAIDMVQSFGGSATPVSWGELYTGLQQGVVDGAENNAPSFYLSRHYEVAKYYTLNDHTMVPDILMISSKVWEDLTEQEKKWLTEAVEESAVVQRKLWAEAEKEALEAVKKAGVEIINPDKEAFSKLVEPMYEGYKSEPEVYELIQRIKAAENTSANSVK